MMPSPGRPSWHFQGSPQVAPSAPRRPWTAPPSGQSLAMNGGVPTARSREGRSAFSLVSPTRRAEREVGGGGNRLRVSVPWLLVTMLSHGQSLEQQQVYDSWTRGPEPHPDALGASSGGPSLMQVFN
ncbi:unnamed protein product [Rangifer tarandus platyrhynchus]|uniref:Uncharacterized protein n=1 Tax=Rangifer tarandus platyrhynchus TaxID=3082113 RepID=A0AC59YPI8_RANTA